LGIVGGVVSDLQPYRKSLPIRVTELGIVGGVVSDLQPDRKSLPMLVTELGIVGGVVSDVQPDRKPSPMLAPEYCPNSNSVTSVFWMDVVLLSDSDK
jgi:hypothetical protein